PARAAGAESREEREAVLAVAELARAEGRGGSGGALYVVAVALLTRDGALGGERRAELVGVLDERLLRCRREILVQRRAEAVHAEALCRGSTGGEAVEGALWK